MTRPPDYAEAVKRGLVAPEGTEGIHTFSNGSEGEGWMEPNCFSCRWYEHDGHAGEWCAFEWALMVGVVSPAMARLFGWVRDEKNDQEGERFGWAAPRQCAFFRARTDDEDGGRSLDPVPDPAQMVLFADPTEDAALIRPGVPELAEAVA